MAFSLEDYVDVAERLRLFYEKYPDGRIVTSHVTYKEWGPITGMFATAEAFRTADDPHPAVGTAWEPVPGKTQFTRDSEVQNAETAAWGRAIVAAGIGTKRISSLEEVRNRTPEVSKSPRGASRSPARASTSAAPTAPATPPADEQAEHDRAHDTLGTADLKVPPKARGVINADQVQKMWTMARGYKLSDDQIRDIIREFGGVESSKAIPKRKFDAVLKEIGLVGTGRIA